MNIKRRLLVVSNLHILNKISFSFKHTEEQAIYEVVLLTLFLVVLACFVGYKLGTTSEVPKGLEVFITLALSLCGFDMTKEFIGGTMQAIVDEKLNEGKAEGLKELDQSLAKVHKQYKDKIYSSIVAQRHRYYLSRIIAGSEPFEISDLRLSSISESVRQEIHSIGASSFQEGLEQEFNEIRTKRLIRCSIQNLPDEGFLQPLAVLSSMHALGKTKAEVNSFPEYKFFRDIYAYLKAWIICSIDNDSGELMPIDTIGLNYPNKDAPNKELYKVALNHVREKLLEKNSSKELLTEPARQSFKRCIDRLIDLIDEYRIPG